MNASYRTEEGNIANAQRTRRANHARDFGGVIFVEADNRCDNLNVIAEAFREQRANRSVNQSAFENCACWRATFTLDKTAWDFACRIHFLFKVDSEREEVYAFARFGGHCSRN